MRGLPSILSLFRNEFNKINNTRARMLDSIYHIEDIYFFEVNTKYISSSAVKKSVFFMSAQHE